jgi:hypothetical protein
VIESCVDDDDESLQLRHRIKSFRAGQYKAKELGVTILTELGKLLGLK